MKILPVVIKNDQVSFTAVFDEILDKETPVSLSVTYSAAGLIDTPDQGAIDDLQAAFEVLAARRLIDLTPDERVVYVNADTKSEITEADAVEAYADAGVEIPGKEEVKDDGGVIPPEIVIVKS